MAGISLIIPTCALSQTTRLSSGRQPYQFRAFLLRCFTLPQAIADPHIDEVIVVGEFEAGVGYQYVNVPNVHHDNIHDALAQRQAGFETATSDWLLYLADDHVLDPHATGRMQKYMSLGDVISLNRGTRMRHANGELLNAGMANGYINGHAACYRRDVLATCPWSNAPRQFTYDIAHTGQIRQAGFAHVYAPDAIAWDCEYGATPWR